MKNVAITAIAALAWMGFSAGHLAAQEPAGKMDEKHAAEFPQGCVDCHVAHQGSEGPDLRINVLLQEVGHRKLGNMVDTVPEDCLSCHEEDEDPTFAQTIHMAHWGEGDNAFVRSFGGDCRHCHAMEASTGEVELKQGPQNW